MKEVIPMAVIKGYREFVKYDEALEPGDGVIMYDVEEGEGWKAETKTWNTFDSEADYIEYMDKIDPVTKKKKASKKSTDEESEA